MSYETGYFGVPGKIGGKVHLTKWSQPACKTRLSRDSEYQFCYNGIDKSIIECERCKKLVERLP